ncbi:hypothetical protein [Vibrio anguillarum]|uniref:Uncharacterized protein n=1 Tax=Vibrio anguillarum TaxID=55601 RepID=A0AAW4BKV3_VIBAN|nr:hypothetical protein [Vibrio anguillarum]MBF4376770.1 hypothetical protein [Vibrio anguillarum]MBF4436278.1 hypothetical protein [Vibrio anguillarum]
MIKNNVEKEFLKFLYNEYVKENGHSYAALNKHKFYFTDERLYLGVSGLCSITKKVESTLYKPHTIEYVEHLESKGLLTSPSEALNFFFTKEGLDYGERLTNPCKYFYKTHWKWFIGVIVTVTNLICLFLYRIFSHG